MDIISTTKKDFVETGIKPLVMAMGIPIIEVEYSKPNPDLDDEYVIITAKGDKRYVINITADSLMAIAYDVINFVNSRF